MVDVTYTSLAKNDTNNEWQSKFLFLVCVKFDIVWFVKRKLMNRTTMYCIPRWLTKWKVKSCISSVSILLSSALLYIPRMDPRELIKPLVVPGCKCMWVIVKFFSWFGLLVWSIHYKIKNSIKYIQRIHAPSINMKLTRNFMLMSRYLQQWSCLMRGIFIEANGSIDRY